LLATYFTSTFYYIYFSIISRIRGSIVQRDFFSVVERGYIVNIIALFVAPYIYRS